MQEVYDFLQTLLGLVLTGDIIELDAGLIIDNILLGAGFAAEQHCIAAGTAHLLHLFGGPAVDEPEQQDHRQEGDDKVQQRVPDRRALVDGAELHEVVVLRDGVRLEGVFVLVHKIDLLVLDLDGGQFLALQHLQEGAVVHALDTGLHQRRIQEDIAQNHDCQNDRIADP